MDSISNILSQRLKTLRDEQNLSQTKVANALGMTLRSYQRIEHRESGVVLHRLCFLADYYNVTVDYLLGRTEERSFSSDVVNPDLTILNQRLKALRNERRLSQTKVAETLDMTLRNYQRIERGDRGVTLHVLCFLADYYGVTVDYLLGRTDERPPSEECHESCPDDLGPASEDPAQGAEPEPD